MKAMFSAFIVMAIISVVAFYGLRSAGFGTDEAQASDSVRIN